MSIVIQRSFASGEIAPALYARVDFSKYQSGLRTLRNFFVMRHGGATNRSGTAFVGEVSDSSKTVRLIPFVVSSSQAYMLEFGEYYIRFIQDGSYLKGTAKNITSITQANPAVVTTSANHGYSTGDEVYLSGIGGMTELNSRNFKITSTGSTTFSLQYMDGTNVNSSSFSAYTSGGTSEVIYEIETTYAEEHLFEIKYIQSADVMTFTHPYYQIRELSRASELSWSIADFELSPGISPPSGSPTASGSAGSDTFSYVITSIAETTFEESLQSNAATASSTLAPTASDPITVSWSAVTGAQEYNVYKLENGKYLLLGVAGGTSFEDIGQELDGTISPPINFNQFDNAYTTVNTITNANPAIVNYFGADWWSNGDLIMFNGAEGMTEVNHNIYKIANINTGANNFELKNEDNTNVDTTSFGSYTSLSGTMVRITDQPSCATYYQQRLCFANATGSPETVWTSKTGQFKNFSKSSPIQSDDAITFTIAGRQLNSVKHLLDLTQLIAFTDSGEWTVGGDESGILRPTSINPRQQSYYGANDMIPIVIGKSALFVQARGSIVRDLGYDFSSDGYRGNDLTIFSAHLFDDYSLTDWAYQQIPHSIVWIVRSDGALLSLTYVREQNLFAWARHDFQGGTVEAVGRIPEGSEDGLYVVINRTIDGSTKRYVERLSSRNIVDIVDSKFMDSCLSYDGRHTGSTTMTLSGGTDWTYLETLTLTASASFFASTDVGNAIHLTGSDGTEIRCTITAYTSATVVSVNPHKTVPAAMRSTAITTWSKAVDEISGLWHLEGEQVSVFADGFVVASPNNDSYEALTVTDGAITLDKPYSVIHVGLPYISDLETLNIDTLSSETMMDKYKNVQQVNIFVEESRGIFAGPKPPTSDTTDPLENLTEFKLRDEEGYDDPVALKTGNIDVNIQPEWNSNGRVFIRQVDPIPLSVLAIAPSGFLPFRGG